MILYCIYLIENLINGKTYIGQHKTNDLNDRYMGSGKILKQAYAKYGIENFTKTILETTDSKEKINELERHYISEYRKMGKAEYNVAHGGDGGNVMDFLTDEQIVEWKRKLSVTSAERIWKDEWRKKISEKRKGMKFSEETRRRISEAGKGRHWYTNGTVSICVKECPEGFRPGRNRWYTNGVENVFAEKCPDGFRAGMTHKKPMSDEGRKNISLSHMGHTPWNKNLHIGRHWYTNGIKSVISKECPEGFVRGKQLKQSIEDFVDTSSVMLF